MDKIYTIIGTEVEECENNTWQKLKDAGWEFIGMKGNHVLMTRRGYINEFWEGDTQ